MASKNLKKQSLMRQNRAFFSIFSRGGFINEAEDVKAYFKNSSFDPRFFAKQKEKTDD
jgi:hypothetical protein